MCGVCGVVTTSLSPEPALLEAMLGQLAHRGPDASGSVRDEHAIIGQTRLAVIDPLGGQQPMCDPQEQVWLVFNGEVFNYLELRDELRARGRQFRTNSDTEVVLQAWLEWGEAAFTRFNGQWALAIWDSPGRSLTLSRDPLGIHPLFYHQQPGRLTFASEVKAVFVDPTVPRELSPAGLAETFSYWSTVAPRTPFAEVCQLPPGHLATWTDGELNVRRYWQADFPARGQESRQDLAANAAELRVRLGEATRLRFERSDVPVAAYLSGGLDSAITAALMAELSDAPLQTYSLRFSDPEFDEGRYQRLVADHLGADHLQVEVSGADIAAVFPDVVQHAEAPLLRAAAAPMFLLSRLVGEHGHKVVVTGEGADELFGGYDLFREARVREFWSRDPDSPLRRRAGEALYPWLARHPMQAPAFAWGFFGEAIDPADPAMSHRPRWRSTSALFGLLNADTRAAVERSEVPDPSLWMPADAMAWDPLSRAQWLELTTLLPGYLLSSQGDRMLMAHSVEGRFPFLDPGVVDLANQLPARHKLFGLQEKAILKHAFADLVPTPVRLRPKQPYRSPDASSFFGQSQPDWVDSVLSAAAIKSVGIFDPGQIAGLRRKAEARSTALGNTDNMRILAVLSTQLLATQLIQAPPLANRPPPQPYRHVELTRKASHD